MGKTPGGQITETGLAGTQLLRPKGNRVSGELSGLSMFTWSPESVPFSFSGIYSFGARVSPTVSKNGRLPSGKLS